MSELNNIPKHWQVKTLGEIGKCVTGTTPPKNDSSNYGFDIPFVKPPQLFDCIINDATERLSNKGAALARILPINSVLVTCIGNLGRTAINKVPVAFNQQINAIIPSEGIDGKYIFYQAQSHSFKSQLEKLSSATTVAIVNKGKFETIEIPIPPLPEQQAIVSKIEELLSDLENGKQQLFTAQQQLKVYRQSLLKAAFEGKLTEDWRKKNIEISGKDTLSLINEKKYNILNNLLSKGNSESSRVIKKNNNHTFKIPEGVEIPSKWCLTSFLNACFLVVDCHNKTAPYQENGIFLIRTSNIKSGKLILNEDIKYVSEEIYNFWSKRCPPESNDILFTREAPMGEAAIIPKDIKVCMGQRIMLLRTFPELLNPQYLHYAIQEPIFQTRMNNNAIGTGVKHLRVGDVEGLVFPLCSPNEQQQIVEILESKLTVCDKIEETISQSLQQAEVLRQSILKKAFEGRLV